MTQEEVMQKLDQVLAIIHELSADAERKMAEKQSYPHRVILGKLSAIFGIVVWIQTCLEDFSDQLDPSEPSDNLSKVR